MWSSRARLSLAALLMLAPPALQAACDAKAETDPTGYDKATARIAELPEFKAWHGLVTDQPGNNAFFRGHGDRQGLIGKRCHWSVTVYSNEGAFFKRWKTFHVPVARGPILVEDEKAQPVPLPRKR